MDVLKMFEIIHNRCLHCGDGAVAQVESIVKGLGAKQLFLLTYDAKAPALQTIKTAAKNAVAAAYVCDIVQDEPDLLVIDRLASLIKEHACDAVVALGGGSVLDAAKAAAMLATNGGTAEEYQMQSRAITCASLPYIAVPTTAGTGSEATKVSVIRNQDLDLKKSIYSPYMVAETVILDPVVTVALPPAVTAFTGIDALSHAVESYVSLNANVYTKMYGLKAIELIAKSLVNAVSDGNNKEARADMLYASYFAGCALHAGIGLAHIIAQPLGGLFKIPHGEACSVFLPHAMEFNLAQCVSEYCEIGRAMGLPLEGNTEENAKKTIEKVKNIISTVKTATHITPYLKAANKQMDEKALDETVAFVMKATGHIKCNPRPVDETVIKTTIKRTL